MVAIALSSNDQGLRNNNQLMESTNLGGNLRRSIEQFVPLLLGGGALIFGRREDNANVEGGEEEEGEEEVEAPRSMLASPAYSITRIKGGAQQA